MRLTSDAGGDPIPDDLRPVLAGRHAYSALRSTEESRARLVDVIEFAALTGADADIPKDVDEGRLCFRRDWLVSRNLDPLRCALVEVREEAMEPTLPAGSLVLVDRTRTDWLPPRILVVRTDNGLVVKRAAYSKSGQPIMANDRPDWPDSPLPPGVEILGQVRWMAFEFD